MNCCNLISRRFPEHTPHTLQCVGAASRHTLHTASVSCNSLSFRCMQVSLAWIDTSNLQVLAHRVEKGGEEEVFDIQYNIRQVSQSCAHAFYVGTVLCTWEARC